MVKKKLESGLTNVSDSWIIVTSGEFPNEDALPLQGTSTSTRTPDACHIAHGTLFVIYLDML